MCNLAIDSKLRGCDLVNLRVRDVMHADQILSRAMIVQRKTQRPVQFELTELTRSAVAAWIEKANLKSVFSHSVGRKRAEVRKSSDTDCQLRSRSSQLAAPSPTDLTESRAPRS